MTNATSTDLVHIDQPSTEMALSRAPEIVLAEAAKAATALKDVIERKSKKVTFNGEQYLEFEDWQTLGRFYGITAKIVETNYVEYGEVHGFEAKAVALRSDGMEISAAEAACLTDEEKWRGRAKYENVGGVRTQVGEEPVPLFQLKSMAQTRASAKVLRNVLAWVAVLAGYRPTPAEELDGAQETRQTTGGKAEPSDGLVRVTDVLKKTGQGARGPWTRYGVTLSDGRTGSTFDEELGRLAATFKEDGAPVEADFEQDGKYLNLKGIRAAKQNESAKTDVKDGELAQDAPSGGARTFSVAKVLDLGQRGAVKVFGVQTVELGDDVLMTADKDQAKLALTAKKNGQLISVSYTERPVTLADKSVGVERWLTDVSLAVGDAVPTAEEIPWGQQ